jgi:hypothetical protein
VSVNVRRAHDPLPTFRRWWRRAVPERRWRYLQWLKLKSGLRRFGRWLDTCWFAMFPRRHPAVALWVFVFVCFGLALEVWTGPPPAPEYRPTEQDKWMQARMQDAVDRALRVIGHGVVVDRVIAHPGDGWASASYHRIWDRIWVDSEEVFSQDEFDAVAAHECVHALFDHAAIDDLYHTRHVVCCVLVEETTAYVLGAHIAGRMRTRQGGDGRALTEKLISRYRQNCDWSSEDAPRRKLWEKAVHEGERAIDPRLAHSIAIHFGSTELVDAIDQICREYPDPWDAVHAVAERYIEPIGEPVVSGQPLPEDS